MPTYQCPDGTPHYWIVTPKVETCQHCGRSRPWDIDGIPVLTGMVKGAPLRPASTVMREAIMALEVGEECVADHRHLTCHFYPSGVIDKCGLIETLKVLRRKVQRERDWDYEHSGEHIATVKRLR